MLDDVACVELRVELGQASDAGREDETFKSGPAGVSYGVSAAAISRVEA